MPFSDYAIDNFISPDLSKLTECNAVEIATRFPQSAHWLANFILNSIFGHPIGADGRRFCYLFLRRAEGAFIDYEEARLALVEFIAGMQDGSRRLLPYFRALHFFEATLPLLWQGFVLFSRLKGEKPFQKGDGSDYERLNTFYNLSKHVHPNDLPPNRLHTIWITNEGLEAEAKQLSFTSLEKLMVEIGELADTVSSCEWHNSQSATETGLP
ncbi:MAG TPA: hypothetical protein VLB46_07850 [Pyrinomonadaceae bacterium]|nr:hypothetical protein [Pyrinomonadaceae bacterium]